EGNPAGIKSLLFKKGICSNYLRLPLVPASEKLSSEIAVFVDNF
ncbi:MAG TPA: 4-hydroxy-tetrahydrodipicolinate synthase, partial [Salinimicrobium sp.]|nr:4-hydroxy-tetrahydrodipicolinate synthase [Salinimicrobium sp.]